MPLNHRKNLLVSSSRASADIGTMARGRLLIMASAVISRTSRRSKASGRRSRNTEPVVFENRHRVPRRGELGELAAVAEANTERGPGDFAEEDVALGNRSRIESASVTLNAVAFTGRR